MKKFALITCACLLAFGVSACGSGGSPAKYHSITFDSKGGSDVQGQTVAHGEKIIKPEDPVKNGYSFNNWLYKNEVWSFSGHVVTEDMTLTAEWSVNTYNITYALDGGTNNPSNPLTYNIEDEFDLQNPLRSGYTFLGWSINEETITGIKKGTFGDLTIKANWSITEYSITYNLDGGTNNPSNPSSYNIKSPTIELMQPTKRGYTFLGWTINGTPISSIENGSTGNLNLDANWKIITYHISYNLNGGINNPSNPFTYTVEDEFDLYNPNRTGHTFSCWLINGEQVSIIKKGTIGDLVIDADWSINHYNAVVKSSDPLKGTVTGGGRYEYNSHITITATTQEDCLFVGWFSDDSFSKLISQDPCYSFSIPDDDITLIAYFITLEESFYEFELNNQSSYTLTKYNSNLTQTIIIPSIFNNLPISSIGTKAFKDCNSITTVIIPNSVTSIGQYAFANCSNLVSISIGSGVTSIGQYAFTDCLRLVEVINKSSLNIVAGSYTFGYVALRAKQVIPDESYSKLSFNEDDYIFYLDDVVYLVEYTGNEAFITIPDSVTCIDRYAFYGCLSLTFITIPDSVTSILEYAFYGCSNLISVSIGSGVTSIGNSAFLRCFKLVEVINKSLLNIVAGSNTFGDVALSAKQVISDESFSKLIIDDDGFIMYLDVDEVCLFGYVGSRTSITIPDSVTSIGEYAFYYCDSLESVTIPNSVTLIGQWAFCKCTSLMSIDVPENVKTIEKSAFYGCTSLTSISLPFIGESQTSNQFIGYIFGASNSSENSKYVPSSLKSILLSGNDFSSIYDYAFYGCSSLTSVTIPNSVTSIGRYAFSGCSSLTSITMHDSVTSISNYSFENCSNLTSITISNSVTSIASYTFSGCSSLTSIIIPKSVTSIGNSAFSGCSNLTSITIPDGVTSIAECAFYNCTSLISITIPDSVKSIGASAFSGCSKLTSITIPDSVTSIGQSAFHKCSSLTSIVIPDSVASIGKSAFYNCTSLASISLPFVGESKTSNQFLGYIFGADSYSGNSNYVPSSLKNIILRGNDISSICDYALSGCPSLTSITISDGVTSIGEHAFYNCTSLTSITIPDSVKSIGASAFSGCSKLTSITIPDKVSSIGQYAFFYCTSLTSITIPNSVKSIGEHVFENCSSLTSITIPDNVISIGQYAFAKCSNLVSVSIGNGVTSIGQYAFYFCSSLKSIVIPDGITSIGQNAFYGCRSLSVVYYCGTQSKWNKMIMIIGDGNSPLTKASIFCYSETEPTESGNYWHYVNGVPTAW